jgi:surface protein
MAYMFYLAMSFNQPIGKWNTAKVTDMVRLFSFNVEFNQPIGNWNTAKVTNMNLLFESASVFNQDRQLEHGQCYLHAV